MASKRARKSRQRKRQTAMRQAPRAAVIELERPLRTRSARARMAVQARDLLKTSLTAFVYLTSAPQFAAVVVPPLLFARCFIAMVGLDVIGVLWVYVFRTRWRRWRVLALALVAATASGTIAGALAPAAGPGVVLVTGMVTLALCAPPWRGRTQSQSPRARLSVKDAA